jgi:hypothetical protein
MTYTPIVECRYGWGQVLRLYRNGLDVQGIFYALSELEQVYPTYHYVLGVPSARIELRFRQSRVVIRGIADVPLAQKIVEYITRWNAVTLAIGTDVLRGAIAPTPLKQLPAPESLSGVSGTDYFWQYDANAMPTTANVISATSVPAMPRSGPASQPSIPSSSMLVDVASAEPWPVMHYSERAHRLKRLQAERELRVYGFDVQALSQHLHDGPLPLVLTPLSLLAGETAHYCIDANLCAEPDPSSSQSKRRVKDRGKLILTNKRLIYLGRKRQIILAYAKFLQISHLTGAVAIYIEDVPLRLFFEMRRPLECSMYLKRLLKDFYAPQNSRPLENQVLYAQPPTSIPRLPAVPNNGPYQQLSVARELKTNKLSLDQLCSTPTLDTVIMDDMTGDGMDDVMVTQKRAKLSGKPQSQREG